MKIAKSVDIPKKTVEIEGASRVGIRWLITKQDGAENFAMRLFEIDPGGHTPLHTHPHEHEVFALEGKGILVYKGAEHPFEPGHAIFVPAGTQHQFKNNTNSILKMLCLIPASAC